MSEELGGEGVGKYIRGNRRINQMYVSERTSDHVSDLYDRWILEQVINLGE